MINVGISGVEIITSVEAIEVHPAKLITAKVNTPGGSPVIVMLVPVPVVVTSPGERVNVHVPDDGKPLNITLPVVTASVGWVISPTKGAEGVGRTVIVVDAEADGPLHPFAVTLTVAAPEKTAAHVTVPVVPEPEIVLPAPVTVQL
jgi:hypothetical protein